MSRICLIGYGNIARKHIEVLRALGCEIVASCNRSEKGNIAAKDEGGVPVTYTNYMEMVEKEKPDGIVNCVNHNNIFAITKELIPIGIPLLVEKPAGTSVKELQELIKLQEEYGTPVQVALNRRHYSVFENAIQNIGGKENIDMISVEWSERPLRAKEDKDYTDAMVEDILIGNSIHGIDLLNFLSGGIDKYNSYTSSKEIGYYHWNMAFSGVSKLGTLVNFTNSWGSPVPWRVLIYSKGKRFEFAPIENCKVLSQNAEDNVEITADDYDNTYKAGFYNQAKNFLEISKNKDSVNQHSLASSLRSMEIAEELLVNLKNER